jgi:hypothetical protein
MRDILLEVYDGRRQTQFAVPDGIVQEQSCRPVPQPEPEAEQGGSNDESEPPLPLRPQDQLACTTELDVRRP